MTTKKALKTIDRGSVIPYAGQNWVVLEHDPSGRTLCLTEGIIEYMAFDDDNSNNFAKASSNRYLNGPFLDNLIDAADTSSAFLKTELDLTTDDGLKDYGTCPVTIFLLTGDLYRRNRDVIPMATGLWWLATAASATYKYQSLTRGVNADGALDGNYACDGYYGLRPACYLNSDLMISVEEDDVTAALAGDIVRGLVETYGGSYATEERFKAAIAFMLGVLRVAREKEEQHE